eukprot:TRINITY_DN11596_c0_g1_i1.p1 TRINITY_DN11596_c0_g1~~TRINITY_DN11596_c0_g1_i1.p1  ORF type:complete len:199 (+),score=10.52 TRINITY_DN11596_c0_g1_i1:71-667(+)
MLQDVKYHPWPMFPQYRRNHTIDDEEMNIKKAETSIEKVNQRPRRKKTSHSHQRCREINKVPCHNLSTCSCHYFQTHSLESIDPHHCITLPCLHVLVPANQLFEEFYKCPECKELFFFSFCLQKVLKYDDYWHCEVCHKCQDVNTWHCNSCFKCTKGVDQACHHCKLRGDERWCEHRSPVLSASGVEEIETFPLDLGS